MRNTVRLAEDRKQGKVHKFQTKEDSGKSDSKGFLFTP